MAVGGTASAPTLGILDREHHGVDLRDCGLHSPGLSSALSVVADFITKADLAPYDVKTRSGELKHVLLTESPDGELMLRLVVRSTADEARVRKHLPWLLSSLPALRVVSLNIQPSHAAVLEGVREIVLTPDTALPMRLEGLELALRPQGFFQTNTFVAAALYARPARGRRRSSRPRCGTSTAASAASPCRVRRTAGRSPASSCPSRRSQRRRPQHPPE
ncbi:hypothetical protein [Nocardioides sp. B-3]|uniref:hypothetical protein n=1 Tax=Nocardioides sp. B-3 TaxID=2895565 RepID=UPI00215377A2|nr:hypothetical protein [Nocardioides sp. B-3]UUZ60061.1 hypothetical protein LP418_03450 [Nocardioides sp. B-3]